MRVKYWKFRYYLTLLFSLFCLFLWTGCNEKEKGEKPSPSPQLTALSAPTDLKVFGDELSWSAVENASGYLVEINEKEGVTIGGTQFDLELKKTETLNISVYAVGDGVTWENSKAGTLQYNYEVPSEGLIYTKIEGGYEVAGTYEKAVGRVVIPDEYEGEPVIRIADNGFGETALDFVGGSLGKKWNYRSVRLPVGLKEIGAEAFASAVNLTEIELPEGLEKIGERAFYDCEKLKKADLPTTLRQLGYSSFLNCVLREVKIPLGIKEIPGACFSRTLITELKIPENVVSIDSNAFAECKVLMNVTLSESLKTLGIGVFYGCRMLSKIQFPSGLERVGRRVMEDTPWWDLQSDGLVVADNILLGYKGEIPENTTLDLTEMGLRLVAGGAFYNQPNLQKIALPQGIKRIEDSTFFGCTGLTEIDLEGVEIIGVSAFSGCTSLSQVSLNAVEYIGARAFFESGLTRIELPGSLKEIGESAFQRLPYLTEVIVNEGVTDISTQFFDCPKIERVVLPSTLMKCSNIPESDELKEFVVSEKNEYYQAIDGCLYSKDGKTLVRYAGSKEDVSFVVPEGVERLGDSAFAQRNNLQSITLPETLTHIGASAFRYCTALTEITIPASVAYIGQEAFFGSGVTKAYFEKTTGWTKTYVYDPNRVMNGILQETKELSAELLENSEKVATELKENSSSSFIKDLYWERKESEEA